MNRESHFPIIDTISLDQILRAPVDTTCGYGLYILVVVPGTQVQSCSELDIVIKMGSPTDPGNIVSQGHMTGGPFEMGIAFPYH